jgi:allophanate hydrolase subunit 1
LPLEREEIKMLIEKAKQKEKEQMIDLAYHIKHLYSFKEHSKLTLDEMVEHHYNSNFKSE